jgi:HD-like signal output (HDOD) protein
MSALHSQPVRDPLAELLQKIDNLAVLPHVVFKVLQISASEDAPPMELERAIIIDPAFSSKVLTLANSAFFGLPRKVTSIREAILFLGFRSVRNLAMTVGAYDMFVGKNDKESLRRRAWWKQSIDTAVACKWIAFYTKKTNPDDAYTSGLLHLIGKTILDRFGAGDFERVTMMTQHGIPELIAEEKAYGCNHISVALAAAKHWGFPESLMAGLDYLRQPEEADENTIPCCITALGSAVAKMAHPSKSLEKSEVGEELPEWALAQLGIQETQKDAVIEQALGAIGAAQLHL